MSEPFIGQVKLYGFAFVPEHWSHCQGQSLSINSNQALFSLLGTAYGGDGRTTFFLPDLRGRHVVSQGIRPGTVKEWKMGEVAGSETVTLTEQNLPSHAHLASFESTGDADVEMSVSTDPAGSDTGTEGGYLALNDGGRNPGVFIYRGDAGSTGTVPLGGVSGGDGVLHGDVTVNPAGSSQAFFIIQPLTALNYCMAMQGLFPSRS